ncbi:MAG: exo-alpha-sialidase [Candidatus Hydrogenedentes bacterium]|nr:exo-alpha-sialidase [Candidatus Hydrogenedentota bacterium]
MTSFLTALFLCAAANAPLYEQQLVFEPDPKHNHSSSIVETPNGDLLVCWFHGSGERSSDDVLVAGARKRKGDDKWSAPFIMADTPNLPDCNPVMFVDPRGTLWLFWVTIQNNEWGGALLKYRTSTDYAQDGPPKWQWQDVVHCRPLDLEDDFLEAVKQAEIQYAPQLKADEKMAKGLNEWKTKAKDKLAQRLGWMPRIHPILLGENRIMLGLYSDVFNCSIAAFTEDWGENWTFSQPIISYELGNIQPAFVTKKNGDIVAFMRDNGIPKCIRTSVSADHGINWTPTATTALPNPGSSVDCVGLKSGSWVLICNDTQDGRHILSAYLSEDEGATWIRRRRFESFIKDQGSGSYPSLIQAADGTLHLTYSYVSQEFKGSAIKHVHFDEAWLRDGEQISQPTTK